MGRLLRVAALVVVAGFLIAACTSSPQGRTPSAGTTTPTTAPSSSPAPVATPSATPEPVTPAPPAANPSPTAAPPAAPPTAPPASGAVSRCLVSELSLSTGGGNAAAGTIGRTFIFTNTSQTTCALYGYPGMQRLSGAQPVQTNVVWTPSPEQTVTLAPGGTASFLAWWHDQTGYTSPCPTSDRIEVTPPNAYSQLTTTVPIQACPDGTINVNAVSAGSTGGQPA